MASLRSALGLGTRPQSAPRHATAESSRQESSSRPQAPQPQIFSTFSTPAVPDSMWFASDFMLGAGMVVIQPSTGKVLLLHDTTSDYWFLPKGRKDIGESLEDAALREAYEESGYRVDFLPVFMPSNAPRAPGSVHRRYNIPLTEPFYVTTLTWKPRVRPPGRRSRVGDGGGEYLTFWYVGQIAEDAVHEPNTGMPDEQDYQSHLLDIQEALDILQRKNSGFHHLLVSLAYSLWDHTRRRLAELQAEAARAESLNSGTSTGTSTGMTVRS
ncbi:hypothetical protein AcW1_002315 [Taiwanofungus camphoratus]|nr:hypothetical protein AcW1_002315 [Antrodia cinnamomea]